MKSCECGCGNEVPFARKRAKNDQPRFLQGHATRVNKNCHLHKQYIPKPEEIPTGICECGCGKQTELAKVTLKAKRHFFGHPLPLLKGHSYKKASGENAGKWNGGRRITDKGYIQIYKPNHPMANSKGYVLEHRFVMSEHFGRLLKSAELVHHKNHDKTDNRLENLEITTRSEHIRMHNLEAGRVPPSRLGARKIKT